MFLFCFCSGDWFHKRSFCLQTGLCAWSRAAVKMPLASLGLPVFDVSQSKCQAHSQPFDPMMSYDLLCFFSFFFFCEKVVVMRCNTFLVLQQLETGRPLPTLAAWAQAEAGDLSIRFPTWDVRISISARLAQDASLALAQHLSSPGLERLWVSEIQIFSFLRRFDRKAQITRNSFVIQNWPQIHHGSCFSIHGEGHLHLPIHHQLGLVPLKRHLHCYWTWRVTSVTCSHWTWILKSWETLGNVMHWMFVDWSMG